MTKPIASPIARPIARPIEGIVPVMITPFTDDGAIDYAGLERLTDGRG
jgi:4-hydroxy-tetrahydrodipicolinate synthase